MAISHLSNG